MRAEIGCAPAEVILYQIEINANKIVIKVYFAIQLHSTCTCVWFGRFHLNIAFISCYFLSSYKEMVLYVFRIICAGTQPHSHHVNMQYLNALCHRSGWHIKLSVGSHKCSEMCAAMVKLQWQQCPSQLLPSRYIHCNALHTIHRSAGNANEMKKVKWEFPLFLVHLCERFFALSLSRTACIVSNVWTFFYSVRFRSHAGSQPTASSIDTVLFIKMHIKIHVNR